MPESTTRGPQHLEQNLEELRQEHEQLEQRLALLLRPRSMSPEEQAEMQGIKKRKLAIKDRLMAIQNS